MASDSFALFMGLEKSPLKPYCKVFQIETFWIHDDNAFKSGEAMISTVLEPPSVVCHSKKHKITYFCFQMPHICMGQFYWLILSLKKMRNPLLVSMDVSLWCGRMFPYFLCVKSVLLETLHIFQYMISLFNSRVLCFHELEFIAKKGLTRIQASTVEGGAMQVSSHCQNLLCNSVENGANYSKKTWTLKIWYKDCICKA